MKIKNELVSIRIGNKQYDLKNLITNNCLTRFARRQLEPNRYNYIPNDIEMSYCLLKFDDPFEINEDIELHNQDFDICLVEGSSFFEERVISSNRIDIKYFYSTDAIYDYKKSTSDVNISDYSGKKIVTIAFNSWFASDANSSTKIPIMAVIDTSNYNIYLQDGQDLKITRNDVITSDCEFYCENFNVKGPLHLLPGYNLVKINGENLYTFGFLYSVGLSAWPTHIEEEFVIGKDIEAVQNNNQIAFKNIENYFSKYFLYSGNSIYPSTLLYPCKKTDYKYVIFKYKVYTTPIIGNDLTPTEIYYYQAISIDKWGLSNFVISYERG